MVQRVAFATGHATVRLGWSPCRGLAATGVLARVPPAAKLARPRWVRQIHNHQELVDEAIAAAAHVGEWRLPVGHAVDALAGHFQKSDFARLLRTRNVKDLQAALPARRVRL